MHPDGQPNRAAVPRAPFATAEDFAAYVESRRSAIESVFRRFQLPPDVGDDILQDTCVLYLQKADSIHPQAACSWFFAVLRQLCRTHYRTRRPQRAITEELLPPAPPAQQRWAARYDLARGLAQLSRRQREILMDYHLRGYEGVELARRHGYAPGSMSHVRERAMTRLREALARPRPARSSRTAAAELDSATARHVFSPRMKKKRGPGRPRTRRPDMLMFNASITPEAKARLMALAEVEGEHAYALLEAAFWDRWKALPTAKRRQAEELASSIETTLRKEAKRRK